MKAGFIGLGTLGRTMAERLLSEGVALTVWNRTRSKSEELSKGHNDLVIADSPSAILAREDIVFLSLFNSGAVKAVIEDRGGLLWSDIKGKLIVDLTSNHFDVVNYFYEAIARKGGTYLEAPVAGSVVPAREGKLTVLISGEKEAYERALPYFEKLGKNIFYLGKKTLATKMKLINNLLLGVFMASIAEAVALSEKSGLPKEKALEILGAGAGNSAVLNAKKEKLLTEDFSPHFKSFLMYKDLHYLEDLAKSLKSPLLTGCVTKELFGMAIAKGMEEMDFSAVYRVFKEFQGT
jgi:3-hydroxyisobutyrate dehydrogenase